MNIYTDKWIKCTKINSASEWVNVLNLKHLKAGVFTAHFQNVAFCFHGSIGELWEGRKRRSKDPRKCTLTQSHIIYGCIEKHKLKNKSCVDLFMFSTQIIRALCYSELFILCLKYLRSDLWIPPGWISVMWVAVMPGPAAVGNREKRRCQQSQVSRTVSQPFRPHEYWWEPRWRGNLLSDTNGGTGNLFYAPPLH